MDRDTTGMLLLTNDGDFAHKVISPKSNVEKCYLAGIDGDVSDEDVRRFAEGMTLGDGTKCLPAGLERLGPGRALSECGKENITRSNACWRQWASLSLSCEDFPLLN